MMGTPLSWAPLDAVLFLCLGSLSCHAAQIGTAHSTVIELTFDNFVEVVESDPANGLWFLKFYAPWCGHCKQLAPVLDAVAPALEGKMALGKIDCTQEAKLCKRFDVRGYPTLLVSRNGGELFPYPSRRDAESIVRFAERMSADPVRAVVAGGHEGALREVADGGEAGVGFVAYDPEAGGGDRGGAVALEEALASTPSLRAYRRAARELQGEAAFGMLLSPGEEGLAGFGGRPAGDGFFVAKIERGVRPKYYVPAAGAGGERRVPRTLPASSARTTSRSCPSSARETSAPSEIGRFPSPSP